MRGSATGRRNPLQRRRPRPQGKLFKDSFSLSPSDKVLDLGGSDGSHIAALGLEADIYIADVQQPALELGAEVYGYTPVLIPPSGELPFPDQYFDVVFCSSVIEHVTVPPDELRQVTSGAEFRRRAHIAQQGFADELRRVAKRYFVQTPNRYFPLESHTWMPSPFLVLPRRWQIALIDRAQSWWPKPSVPDFHLLDAAEMAALFPEARIVREKSFGLTKSLIALR